MAWKGNPDNPVPNHVQLASNVAEIREEENRALNIRRDQDNLKDFTVKLIDIDTTIFEHLNDYVNIHILDNGESIKVPLYYASQEKWKAIQKDGVLRDQQGKLQLPSIVFRRSNFEKDTSMMTLNRHLTYPILSKFNEKNKYDRFSVLNNKAGKVHQVFGVTLPDHIRLTYEFTCWCEYIEQLNEIVQKINFACEEYWGDKNRFKFRVYSSGGYSFTNENPTEDDRLVRCNFNLDVRSYLLEESFESRETTIKRSLTPRTIKIGTEIAGGEEILNLNKEELQNLKPIKYSYINGKIVPDGEVFDDPGISYDD